VADLTVCFYTGRDRSFKRGTNLGYVHEALAARGVRCTSHDADVEPDVYVFEKSWHEVRYDKPKIVRAENLIGDETLRTHAHDKGSAIVFNTEWLRTLYRNTFGHEHPRVYVIPPGHRAPAGPRRPPPLADGARIVCAAKWWKRPFKRFPLIAAAFTDLARRPGYENSTLHVLGWLTDQPMPFVETRPRLWRIPRPVRRDPRIVYHPKGFHDDLFDEVMGASHLLIHASPVDSGPQVVAESLTRGMPVVITNNMGAAEWVRAIGDEAGRVVEADPVTTDAAAIADLPLYKRRYCSDTTSAPALADAMASVLEAGANPVGAPSWLTMDGIADAWLAAFEELV
jgi:glycosyltransferase involved in cell wall biosynthesis